MKVILDCERMKYPNTGLYHFCLRLGKAMSEIILPEQDQIGFYISKNAKGIFGINSFYFLQHALHKFFFPRIKGFSIWHTTYQGTNYFPFNKKLRIVLTIHDFNFMHEEKRSENKKARLLRSLQKKINRADHIVVISNFVKQDLLKFVDCKSKPVSVIYNGCNIVENISEKKPYNAPTQPFLFTIGTVTDKKNFHVLSALLVGNNYQLVIAGITQSESYKQLIIDEAKKLHVLDRLIFSGPIDETEKYWYLNHCNAFLFPSLLEGFGLPVIEAMAFGKPVFLSKATSLPEIGGDTAYYFENFEANHMQEIFESGMIHYYSDEKAIKEKIKDRAAIFNWENAATQYLTIYRTLDKN